MGNPVRRIAPKTQRKSHDRISIVRYEDMVTEPTEVFRRIFQFVGVPFDDDHVDMLAWREELDEYYPDRPHRDDPVSLGVRLKAIGLLSFSPLKWALQQFIWIFRRSPLWRIRRMIHRVKVLWR